MAGRKPPGPDHLVATLVFVVLVEADMPRTPGAELLAAHASDDESRDRAEELVLATRGGEARQQCRRL